MAKKVYVKPEIFFENFSLSQHIAGGCNVAPNSEALGMTGAGPNGGIGYVFSSTCDVPIVNAGGDGEYNGVCYQVMSDDAWGTLSNS